MNINDLTIGQAREISQIFQSKAVNLVSIPVEIGKAYLFRTVTHIEVGRVLGIDGVFITLENASWIPDTGRYHNCLRDGVFNEVEPYPETTTINSSSIVNFTPWLHELPTEQK